ncbi:MAG: hypothetical protein HQ522_08995 [Bacteroidetes bacterium]|nr:hypothetical protein [Bacteroidota bacterium]
MSTIEEIYNNITEEELVEIETMAGLFFDLKSICIAMGWNEDMLEYFALSVLTMNINDKLYCAYFKGRLESEIELRQSIKQASKNGSNPAQNTLRDFMNNSKL